MGGTCLTRLQSTQSSFKLVRDPITSGISEISFCPMSSLSKHVKRDNDFGRLFRLFSRSSRILSFASLPKLAGKTQETCRSDITHLYSITEYTLRVFSVKG